MASVPPGTVRSLNLQFQNESPFMFTLLNLTNTITNLFLGAVAFSAFIFANSLTYKRHWIVSQHIYLCVFGYVILLVQGILSMNINTGWARVFSCDNKRTIHYILQVLGSILAIAGCLRVLLSAKHGKHGKHGNDISIHGICGLIAMVLTILSLIGGVVNLFSTKMSSTKNFIKIGHAILGCFTIVFAFLAMALYPFTDNMFGIQLGYPNENLFISIVVISLILVLIQPIMDILRLLRRV